MYQTAIIQYLTSMIFRSAAMMIQERVQDSKNNNKNIYTERKAVLSLLKLSSIVGGVSENLYLAMYFYRDGQFLKSLRYLQRAMDRMSQPYVVYQNVITKIYNSAMKELSLSGKLKKAFIDNIHFINQFTYIDEIAIEIGLNKEAFGLFGKLIVPPLVVLHLLFVLNHQKTG